MAALAILAAIVHREKTGKGQYLDVSMHDGVVSWLSIHAGKYLLDKELPKRGEMHLSGRYACYQVYSDHSIAYIVVFLTVIGTVLSVPNIGLYYGLHEWTAAHTGGVVDARFIAGIDTALESPLGQVAMIPMLAWIANSAPASLKATFFAVMASFTNLALSLAQLGTKYANRVFAVSREVRDPATGAVTVPADCSELGMLLIAVTLIGFALPIAAVLIIRRTHLESA